MSSIYFDPSLFSILDFFWEKSNGNESVFLIRQVDLVTYLSFWALFSYLLIEGCLKSNPTTAFRHFPFFDDLGDGICVQEEGIIPVLKLNVSRKF